MFTFALHDPRRNLTRGNKHSRTQGSVSISPMVKVSRSFSVVSRKAHHTFCNISVCRPADWTLSCHHSVRTTGRAEEDLDSSIDLSVTTSFPTMPPVTGMGDSHWCGCLCVRVCVITVVCVACVCVVEFIWGACVYVQCPPKVLEQ